MNNPNAWIQLALFVGALLLVTKPLGLYLVAVLDIHGKTWLDRIIKPIERATYRLCRIEPGREQGWFGYTVSLLTFSLVGMLATYFILRYQDRLPLNPQGFPGVSPNLAFQHRRELHHEHQLAELRRRIDDVLLLPDGRACDP